LKSLWQRIVITSASFSGVFAGYLFEPESAIASFSVCNRSTFSDVSVSIGHKEQDKWVSEGWWNLSSGQCEVVYDKDLIEPYFYLYAFGQTVKVEGQTGFCVNPNTEFRIEGSSNCAERAYESRSFLEINTLGKKDWTQEIRDQIKPFWSSGLTRDKTVFIDERGKSFGSASPEKSNNKDQALEALNERRRACDTYQERQVEIHRRGLDHAVEGCARRYRSDPDVRSRCIDVTEPIHQRYIDDAYRNGESCRACVDEMIELYWRSR
jgi:uncharacterized membrane protein